MSKVGYSFRPQAKRDALAIALYINQDSPKSASNFLSQLEVTCDRIASLPVMGSPRSFNNPVLKQVYQVPVSKFGHYLIFYREEAGAVEVIRVVHGARDLPNVFKDSAD